MYKFVCDPEALFNMAYGEYSQANRAKSESGQETPTRTSYTDMFTLYGASGSYAHLQQYLGTTENGQTHFKPSPFRLGLQQYQDQGSGTSHLQMLQTFTSETLDPHSCSQQKRNFESSSQEDQVRSLYRNRTLLPDPTSRPRPARPCDVSPLDSSFKHSPVSESTLLEDTTSTYQCLSVGSCVC